MVEMLFDNMISFRNGYDIVDKNIQPNEITLITFGVCDEDMYNKAIE
jgi:hypothetical protein